MTAQWKWDDTPKQGKRQQPQQQQTRQGQQTRPNFNQTRKHQAETRVWHRS